MLIPTFTATTIIPLVGQLLRLGFKIADIVEKANSIKPEDKHAMRAAVKKAQSRVTYWKPEDSVPL